MTIETVEQWNVADIAVEIVVKELESRGFSVARTSKSTLRAKAASKIWQIQVKGATNTDKEWMRGGWIHYGFCTPSIIKGTERAFSHNQTDVVVLVAVRSSKEYRCIVLPVGAAEQAAQMNLDRDYRTPTADGRTKKPHKMWAWVEYRPHLRADVRLKDTCREKEQEILSRYRDKWEEALSLS